MYGDFTRDSYDPTRNFSRLLLQAGRETLDADWNEQNAIILNYLRELTLNIIGWHGGPDVKRNAEGEPLEGGLKVSIDKSKNLSVTGGRYYADGHLLDLREPNYTPSLWNSLSKLQNQLVIVDVWERHVSAMIDNSLDEPGLLGRQTCDRVEIAALFRVLFTNLTDPLSIPPTDQALRRLRVKPDETAEPGPPIDSRPLKAAVPKLTAWVDLKPSIPGPCDDEAALGYTGLENQLYRVEIHNGGHHFWQGLRTTNGKLDGDKDPEGIPAFDDNNPPVTFKWSRDNASIAYPIISHSSKTLTLEGCPKDGPRAIHPREWLEILPAKDDRAVWQIEKDGPAGTMVKVASVEHGADGTVITFAPADGANVTIPDNTALIARRWDYRARRKYPLYKGAIVIEQKKDVRNGTTLLSQSIDIPLEDGIYIQFKWDGADFRPGDYWLIPARESTNDIIWPKYPDPKLQGANLYKPVDASYAVHHYAPLALVTAAPKVIDLRKNISLATEAPPRIFSIPSGATADLDLAKADEFIVVLTGACTIKKPTSGYPGRRFMIQIKQTAAAHTAIWDPEFTGPGAVPTTPAQNTTDIINVLQTEGNKWEATVVAKDVKVDSVV